MAEPFSELFPALSTTYSTNPPWCKLLISTSMKAVQKANTQSIDDLRYYDLLHYITHFYYSIKICLNNGSFSYREIRETQVAIRRCRWSVLSWCATHRSNFLVKPNTSSRISTVVRYTLKVSGNFGFGMLLWRH